MYLKIRLALRMAGCFLVGSKQSKRNQRLSEKENILVSAGEPQTGFGSICPNLSDSGVSEEGKAQRGEQW